MQSQCSPRDLNVDIVLVKIDGADDVVGGTGVGVPTHDTPGDLVDPVVLGGEYSRVFFNSSCFWDFNELISASCLTNSSSSFSILSDISVIVLRIIFMVPTFSLSPLSFNKEIKEDDGQNSKFIHFSL